MMAGKVSRGKCSTNEKEKSLAGSKAPSHNSESAMDECFTKLNLYRKSIAKDGSCLFRVVAEQIYHTQAKHYQVRLECINFMHLHRDYFESFIEGSFEHHLFLLKNPEEWGGQVEISALSQLYKCDFIVFQGVNPEPCPVTCNGYDRKILLSFSNGNHYDALYPIQFKSNAAIVQSLLYDLLINTVYPKIDQLEEKNPAVETSSWTQVNANKIKTSENTADKSYWQIKRSLDPNIYRNIEVEVWEENKTKLQQSDRSLAISMHFKPGDLCLATIKESEDVSKTIRVRFHEIQSDKCIVLTENLKHRYFVRLEDIKLITNENDEYYKNLPGYYNKHENDSDFLQPKRRVKSRRERHDDDRNRPRNGEQNKRHEKEIKNIRRGMRKEESKKKEPEEIKLKLDLLDVKDTNQPLTPSTPSCEIEVKVAHPAESSAAFWGRMRVKPSLTISPHSPNLIHESFNRLEGNSNNSPQKIDKTENKPIISTKVDISPIDANRHLDKNTYENAENQNSIQNVVSSRSEDKSTILNAASNIAKPAIKSSPLSKLPPKNVTNTLLVKETQLQSNPQTQGSQTPNMNSHSLKSSIPESTKLSEVREKVIDKCLTPSSSSESLSSLSSESLSSKVIDVTNTVNLSSNVTMLNSVESNKPFLKTSSTENLQSENILHLAKELPLISQDEIISDIRDDVDNTTDNSEESVSTDESTKDRKKKKKVSFATDAQIINSGNSSISHSPALNNQTPNCEPGKIKLPPEHIEKHINEFSQAPDMRQQNLLQATYNHNGVPIIPQLPIPGVLPIYYQNADQVLAPVAFSHDSEGKDLPEDITTIRHFFNLGLQWYCMMIQQQQNGLVNQPGLMNQSGILPLPAQPQVQIRHILLTGDVNMPSQSHDSYLKKPNEPLNDIQQQQTLIQSQLDHQHQVFFVPPNTYEQYELPPRMRRVPFPRQQNSRYVQPRYYNQRNGIVEHVSRARIDIQKGIPPQGMNFHTY